MTIDVQGLEGVPELVHKLGNYDQHDVLSRIGQRVTEQIQRRIAVDKTAPDGAKWEPWSRSYARRRKPGDSLLEASGRLRKSITFHVFGNHVDVGTPLRYGRDLQIGTAIIKHARPFIGLSANDERDVLDELEDALRDQLKGALS